MSAALILFALRLAVAAPDDPEGEDGAPPPAAAPAQPQNPSSSAPSSAPSTPSPPSSSGGASTFTVPSRMGADTLSIGDAYIAAQTRQGALDGTWRIDEVGGDFLYVLQISDAGSGADLEGAWRDPRRKGATDSSGFLSSIRRTDDGGLEIRFSAGLFPERLVLKPAPGGGWTGDLIHDGPRRKVAMTRY
jgi:hypothetical protein